MSECTLFYKCSSGRECTTAYYSFRSVNLGQSVNQWVSAVTPYYWLTHHLLKDVVGHIPWVFTDVVDGGVAEDDWGPRHLKGCSHSGLGHVGQVHHQTKPVHLSHHCLGERTKKFYTWYITNLSSCLYPYIMSTNFFDYNLLREREREKKQDYLLDSPLFSLIVSLNNLCLLRFPHYWLTRKYTSVTIFEGKSKKDKLGSPFPPRTHSSSLHFLPLHSSLLTLPSHILPSPQADPYHVTDIMGDLVSREGGWTHICPHNWQEFRNGYMKSVVMHGDVWEMSSVSVRGRVEWAHAPVCVRVCLFICLFLSGDREREERVNSQITI